MKKIKLIPFAFGILLMSHWSGATLGQQTTPLLLRNIDFSPVIALNRQLIQSLSIIPGSWTRGDWDNPQIADNFVKDLNKISDRLEEVQDLIDEANGNPKPSAGGRILGEYKASKGQLNGLKSVTEQHLANPTAKAEVLSSLESAESLLDDAIELLFSNQ